MDQVLSVYVLYTGGTIGCTGTPLSPLSTSCFTTAFDSFKTYFLDDQAPNLKVTIDGFDNTLDSTNMQPSEWVEMAQMIVTNYNSYDAFVVLHGTDSLAWTASALSFLLPGLSKPVIVTGSQLPLFLEIRSHTIPYDCANSTFKVRYNTDAVRNLLGSFAFLSMNIPEVCVFFADNLLRGNRSVKANSSDFVAFATPNYPVLGRYGVNAVLHSEYIREVPTADSLSDNDNLSSLSDKLDTILSQDLMSTFSVLQIQTFPGYHKPDDGTIPDVDNDQSMFASILSQLQSVSPTLRGVIFESYGIGNIPSFSSVQKQIEAMNTSCITQVDCTQVSAGGVDYSEYAAGAWLGNYNVVGGQDMTPIAAMAKLTVQIAFAYQADRDIAEAELQSKMVTLMGQNLEGELTDSDILTSYQEESLFPSESLFSINSRYELQNVPEVGVKIFDLSLLDPYARPIWKLTGDTFNSSTPVVEPGKLTMMPPSTLTLYGENGDILWTFSPSTNNTTPAYVKLENDGQLMIREISTDNEIEVIPSPETLSLNGSVKTKGGRKKTRRGAKKNKRARG